MHRFHFSMVDQKERQAFRKISEASIGSIRTSSVRPDMPCAHEQAAD